LKDCILNVFPEVGGILLNTTNHDYDKAGVCYIEYSISSGYLTPREGESDSRFKKILESVYLDDEASRKKTVNIPVLLDEIVDGTKGVLNGWHNFVDFYPEPSHQKTTFLAAFNRERIDHNSFKTCSAIEQKDLKDDHTKAFERLAFSQEKAKEFLWKNVAGEDFSKLNLAQMLHRIAKYYCTTDSALEALYPTFLTGDGNECDKLRNALLDPNPEHLLLNTNVVGLDWVGDELGHPFCALTHSKFIKLILDCQKSNPRFGVRIHAGEGIIRPATFDENMLTSKVYQAFCFHVFVIMETVKELHKKIANIRIGHGIAFLFGHDHDKDAPSKKSKKTVVEGEQVIRNFIEVSQTQASAFTPIGQQFASYSPAIVLLAELVTGLVTDFVTGGVVSVPIISPYSSSAIGTNISKGTIEKMNLVKDDTDLLKNAVLSQFRNEACVEYLIKELQDFRKEYLEDTVDSKKIVCELCPTSNNMLLSSSFDASNHNIRTLRTFLDLNLAVTLSTDDDGVRRINKCKAHNHHTSLAAEYCEAIVNGDIQTEDELDRMINRGISAAFLN